MVLFLVLHCFTSGFFYKFKGLFIERQMISANVGKLSVRDSCKVWNKQKFDF